MPGSVSFSLSYPFLCLLVLFIFLSSFSPPILPPPFLLSAHSRERRVPRSGFIRRFRLSHRFRFIENAIFHRIFQGRVISLGRSGFTGNPVFSGSQICEAKWTKFPVSALTDNLFPAHRLRDGRAIGLESSTWVQNVVRQFGPYPARAEDI